MNETNELTPFVATVRESGGSLEITLDSNAARFEGLKKGDTVKVLVKKLQKKEVTENENGN